MDKYEELVQENEELRAQVYNLTLYLHLIEKRLPWMFQNLMNGLDGMPGYDASEVEQ